VREKDGGSRPEVDTERGVARTALAVLHRARDDLSGTPFSLVLADERARVIERVDGIPTLAVLLDRLNLAPGYRWSEEHIGTNALGTALAREQPLLVRGRAHAMKALAELACAATPIVDPRSGRPVGVVALACRIDASSELMLSYVRQIGREIEDGLVDDSSASERVLMTHFVRARRHARGAIASVNDRTMITNAAASRLVDDADRASLWEWAQGAIARGLTEGEELHLATGSAVTARCEPVESGARIVGALVRLDPASRASAQRLVSKKKRARQPTFGWTSLSPSQLGIAELVASGMTNQEVATRLYLSRHTVDFHLRQVFSKLGIDSRVELARHVSLNQEDQRRTA
jgi:transcriptional regulator of acetoin/glycerol metabolism